LWLFGDSHSMEIAATVRLATITPRCRRVASALSIAPSTLDRLLDPRVGAAGNPVSEPDLVWISASSTGLSDAARSACSARSRARPRARPRTNCDSRRGYERNTSATPPGELIAGQIPSIDNSRPLSRPRLRSPFRG